VELFGLLAKRQIVSTVLSRKLTHIFTGSTAFTLFILFPRGQSWPGRLLVSLFMGLFMAAFALLAYLPDESLQQLPPALRERVERIVSNTCRSGRRQA
jgi:hypothetical protein